MASAEYKRLLPEDECRALQVKLIDVMTEVTQCDEKSDRRHKACKLRDVYHDTVWTIRGNGFGPTTYVTRNLQRIMRNVVALLIAEIPDELDKFPVLSGEIMFDIERGLEFIYSYV